MIRSFRQSHRVDGPTTMVVSPIEKYFLKNIFNAINEYANEVKHYGGHQRSIYEVRR